jgi:putative ABC transport system substrate-binding protein
MSRDTPRHVQTGSFWSLSLPAVTPRGEEVSAKVLTVLAAKAAKPKRNAAGALVRVGALAAKRMELLHGLVPKATVIGYLANPNNPLIETTRSEVQAAAGMLGLQLHSVEAGTEREIDQAFTDLAKEDVGALFVGGDPFFFAQRNQIVRLAARYSLPASYYTANS